MKVFTEEAGLKASLEPFECAHFGKATGQGFQALGPEKRRKRRPNACRLMPGTYRRFSRRGKGTTDLLTVTHVPSPTCSRLKMQQQCDKRKKHLIAYCTTASQDQKKVEGMDWWRWVGYIS